MTRQTRPARCSLAPGTFCTGAFSNPIRAPPGPPVDIRGRSLAPFSRECRHCTLYGVSSETHVPSLTITLTAAPSDAVRRAHRKTSSPRNTRPRTATGCHLKPSFNRMCGSSWQPSMGSPWAAVASHCSTISPRSNACTSARPSVVRVSRGPSSPVSKPKRVPPFGDYAALPPYTIRASIFHEPLLHVMKWLAPVVWVMSWLGYLDGTSHLLGIFFGFAGSQIRGQLDLAARYNPLAWPGVQASETLAMFHYDATSALRGGSTRMTSAPWSASMRASSGPASY